MTAVVATPSKYTGNSTPWNAAKVDRSGAVRNECGTVTMPNKTAEGAFVGLVPFQKGARFIIGAHSVHISDIDAGSDSKVNLGIIYASSGEGTDDVDAFVLESTSGQTGGFLTPTSEVGLTYVTTGNGWLALENQANISEVEGTITFNVGVVYDI